MLDEVVDRLWNESETFVDDEPISKLDDKVLQNAAMSNDPSLQGTVSGLRVTNTFVNRVVRPISFYGGASHKQAI